MKLGVLFGDILLFPSICATGFDILVPRIVLLISPLLQPGGNMTATCKLGLCYGQRLRRIARIYKICRKSVPIMLAPLWFSVPTLAQVVIPEECSQSVWARHVRHDKLTGEPSIEACKVVPVEQRARVQVTAYCGFASDTAALNSIPDPLEALRKSVGAPSNPSSSQRPKLDERTLWFQFKYLPSNPNVHLRRSPVPQQPQSCTFLPVMVDGSYNTVQSLVCNDDWKNFARISFSNFRAIDIQKALVPSYPNDPQSDPSGLGRALNKIMRDAANATDPTIATMDEVFQSNEVKVVLPLSDGDSTLVPIYPQEPTFRDFSAACNREFPAPPPVLRAPGDYGPPSVSDSYWNLLKKTTLLFYSDLNKYLKSLVAPGVYAAVPGVSGVPGSNCPEIFVPGDVVGPVDWNSPQTETVYTRCHTFMRPEFTVGQVEIDPDGLADLKKRRADLISLGASADPAPAEPDALDSPLPPSWNLRSSWFLCPPMTSPFHINMPTEASIIGHPKPGSFQIHLGADTTNVYAVRWNLLHESCTANRTTVPPVQPSSQSNDNESSLQTPSALGTLFIHSGFSGQPNPLAGTAVYLLRFDIPSTLTRHMVSVPPGLSASESLDYVCRQRGKTPACIAAFMRMSESFSIASEKSTPEGEATFTQIYPGLYYVLIYAQDPDHQTLVWNERIKLTAGANSFTAGPENSKPLM